MKIYSVKSHSNDQSITFPDEKSFEEFTSSATKASAIRTRLKKLGHTVGAPNEYEVDASRDGFIKFLNDRHAHESWVVEPVAEKLA